MKNYELSIILPVFNEAAVIEAVTQEIYEYTARHGISAEIIIVNDGSTDDTPTILNKISLSFNNIKLISHPQNGGYGKAMRSGISAAQGEWILLMDSDGQIRIDALQKAWPCRHEYDVLLGYRQKRSDGFYRHMLGKSGNALSNIFLRRNLQDINCGFKLFRKNFLKPLTLSSSGGIINFEIFYQLFKNHQSLRLQQFPIKHYPRQLGKSTGGNPGVIGKIFVEGFKILLSKLPQLK